MFPRSIRRTTFFGALALGAIAFATVARPESCMEIWTLNVQPLRPCCRLGSRDRLTGPEGDCCHFGSVEERDPVASAAPVTVAPAAWIRMAVASPTDELEPSRIARRSIPERPPDRGLRATVLLI